MGDIAGGIVLGLLGAGVGVVAVDYAFSEPGDSWVARLMSGVGTTHSIARASQPKTLVPSPTRPARSSAHTQTLPPPLPPHPFVQTHVPAHAVPLARATTVTPFAPSGALTAAMVKEFTTRLNAMLNLHLPVDGTISTELMTAVTAVQRQLGLPITGFPDLPTLNALRGSGSAAPTFVDRGARHATTGYWAGAATPLTPSPATLAASDWPTETNNLGSFAQNVLSHLISLETDKNTLNSVGKLLAQAGYPLASAAVLAKATGGVFAATGWW